MKFQIIVGAILTCIANSASAQDGKPTSGEFNFTIGICDEKGDPKLDLYPVKFDLGKFYTDEKSLRDKKISLEGCVDTTKYTPFHGESWHFDRFKKPFRAFACSSPPSKTKPCYGAEKNFYQGFTNGGPGLRKLGGTLAVNLVVKSNKKIIRKYIASRYYNAHSINVSTDEYYNTDKLFDLTREYFIQVIEKTLHEGNYKIRN